MRIQFLLFPVALGMVEAELDGGSSNQSRFADEPGTFEGARLVSHVRLPVSLSIRASDEEATGG